MKLDAPNFNPDAAAVISQEDFPLFFREAVDREEASGVILRRIEFPEETSARIDWKNCCFESCRFQKSALSGGYFGDVIFRRCDFSGADFHGCSFARVKFEDCRATGVNMFESNLRDAFIQGGAWDYASFTKTKLKAVRFEECKLSDSGFDESSFKDVIFEECGLGGANFLGTSLNGIDLTTCEFGGALFTQRELKGAIVTPLQAVELAAMLGIVIKG